MCGQNDEMIFYKMAKIETNSSERIIYQEDDTIGFDWMSQLTQYIMSYKLPVVPYYID